MIRQGHGWPLPVIAAVAGGWLVAQVAPGLVVVGAAVLLLAASRWAHPLRQQAAVAGSPPLLGWTPPQQARRHLLLPAVATLGPALLGVALAELSGDPGTIGRLTPFTLLPLLLGTVTWSAFRRQPGVQLVAPQLAIAVLLLWWAGPVLLVALVTGAALWWADGVQELVLLGVIGLVALSWSLARLESVGRRAR